MEVKITGPFFYQNKWFFEGDKISGEGAKKAVAEGAANAPKKTTRKKKSAGAAPENKAGG